MLLLPVAAPDKADNLNVIADADNNVVVEQLDLLDHPGN